MDSSGGLLIEAAQNRARQALRDFRARDARWFGDLLHNLSDYAYRPLGFKRRSPGKQVIKGRPNGIDVRSNIEFFPLQLFR